MNKDIIKGHWKEIKGKVKQKWGKLTDDDIANIEGSHEELVGRLQKAYGYEKEDADREVSSFFKRT